MLIKFKPEVTGVLSVFLSLAALSSTGWAQPPAGLPGNNFVPGELIILLGHGHGVPRPEEVVDRRQQGLPLPAGLGAGSPRDVKFLMAAEQAVQRSRFRSP